MRKTRHLGSSVIVGMLLVGGLATCSQSEKAGIVLNVRTDNTVADPTAITSLQVTVNDKMEIYDLKGSPLPGTLGIKTSPGSKHIIVEGLAGSTPPVARWEGTVVAESGQVTQPIEVILTAVAAGSDAGIVPDGSPSGTGGAPGFDGSPGSDVPASTGGGSGAKGGATTSGGTTSTGGVTSTGGLSKTGGSSPTGGTSSLGGATNAGGSQPTGGTTSTGGTTKLVATVVAAGFAHSCAVINDGTIRCWGNNTDGELGNGDPLVDGTTIISSKVPVQVLGVTQAVSVATGGYHTCALLAAGTVQCWGYNGDAQLGNGSRGGRSTTPADVSGLPTGLTVVSVVTGHRHTCALLSDKTVSCWGDNSSGNQLGMGDSNLISSIIPVTVVTDASTHSALSNVTALAATHDFACAVQSTGAVYCWGDNSSGQLGNGNTDETTVAVKAGKVQAVGIGAGGDQSCALMSPTTGSPFNVQCWGGDFDGELGNNDENDSYAPVNAQVSGNASAIALGWSHSCAVLADVKGVTGTIQCWGYNYYGQLGNRSTDDSDVPVAVYGLSQATSLSAGEYHTCAVVNGAVYCWGDNSYGNLGDGKGGPDVTTPQPSLVSGF